MSTTTIPIASLAIFVGGFLLLRIFRAYHLSEYLFLNRYPLILAIVLFTLPVLGSMIAPASLENIFVMAPRELFGTVFAACFASGAIVYTSALITASIPARHALTWRRAERENWREFQFGPQEGVIVQGGWLWAACILPLPVSIAVVWKVDPPRYVGAAAWAALGYAAALVLRKGMVRFSRRRIGESNVQTDAHGNTWIAWIPLGILHRYGDLPRPVQFLHIKALWFFLLSVGVYLAIGAVGSPDSSRWVWWMPGLATFFSPLAFAHMLIAMMAWILSALSFHFDRERIPAVSLAIVAILIIGSVIPYRHEYSVFDWPQHIPKPPTVSTILQQRWAQDPGKPRIVVAASGGGITASYWAACVLQGLESEWPGYSSSVDLVSAVSGGGIASMLYVDAFAEGAVPSGAAFDAIVENAGRSTLTATTWGLAYPDLWQPLLGWAYRKIDRGWAQDMAWGKLLATYGEDQRPARLSDWTAGTVAGWRPIHIANVSLQETGQRLLLAPVPINTIDPTTPPLPAAEGPPDRPSPWLRMRHDLFTFVPDGDMRIATAARLSATFPYVSPQAAPEITAGVTSTRAYHSADGGYFDNSGLVAVLESLLDVLGEDAPDQRPERIAIIEIRAARAAEEIATDPTPANRGGVVNAAIGPLETLYNARVSTQIARTAIELDLAFQFWENRHQVIADRFVFHLSGEPPLSWHLTEAEKRHIRAHWPTFQPYDADNKELVAAREHNRSELGRLKRFLDPESALSLEQRKFGQQREY